MSEPSEKEPVIIVLVILLAVALLLGLWFLKHLLLFYFCPRFCSGFFLENSGFKSARAKNPISRKVFRSSW